MEIKYDIDDSKVANFTDEAKLKLTEHSHKHILDVISEAEKVEASLREYGATSEITSNIIFQAVRKIRNHPVKKFNWVIVLLKIFSELLLFIAGCLFNLDNFSNNNTQLYLFCGIFCVAVILTITVHFKEGQ